MGYSRKRLILLAGPPSPFGLRRDSLRVACRAEAHAWLDCKRERRLVRKKGLEPSRPCGRQPLKLVRLPIPPLPRSEGVRRVRCAEPGLLLLLYRRRRLLHGLRLLLRGAAANHGARAPL